MSKTQILFSVDDPLGYRSNSDINFSNHCKLKNGDVSASKFFPRGKTYWKLFHIQDEERIKKILSRMYVGNLTE